MPSPQRSPKVVRRGCLARSTQRSPQVFPTVLRSVYPGLTLEVKQRLLDHTESQLNKLKRDLGEAFAENLREQTRRSPASTPGSSAEHARWNYNPNPATIAPRFKYQGRRHLHPLNFVASPESPNSGPRDPRRDGSRSRRAIWLDDAEDAEPKAEPN